MFKKKYTLFLLTLFLVCQTLTYDAYASSKCSRLLKTAGGEQLINSCDSCRIVKIQRKRPSADAPINRTFTVPPKTTTVLSFRGPGHSRVLSDTSCQTTLKNNKKSKAMASPKKIDKRCVMIQRTTRAGITGLALANTCDECRVAVVDRIDKVGSRRSQNVAIQGKSTLPLFSKGAIRAGVMSEKSCK